MGGASLLSKSRRSPGIRKWCSCGPAARSGYRHRFTWTQSTQPSPLGYAADGTGERGRLPVVEVAVARPAPLLNLPISGVVPFRHLPVTLGLIGKERWRRRIFR
jgi:hypothetical protein